MTRRSEAPDTRDHTRHDGEPSATDVLELAARLSRCPLPLLVKGGRPGDRLRLAHSVHDRGPRATEPVVCVACETLDPDEGLAAPGGHPIAGQAALLALALATAGTVILDGVERLSRRAQRWLLVAIDGLTRPGAASRPGARVVALCGGELGSLAMSGAFLGELRSMLSATVLEIPELADGDPLFMALRERIRRARRATCPPPRKTVRNDRPLREPRVIGIGRAIRFKRPVGHGAGRVATGTLGRVVSVLPRLCVELEARTAPPRGPERRVVQIHDTERDIAPVSTMAPPPSQPRRTEWVVQVERPTTLPPPPRAAAALPPGPTR